MAPHWWTSFPKVFNAIFRDGSGQLGKIALCAATSTTKWLPRKKLRSFYPKTTHGVSFKGRCCPNSWLQPSWVWIFNGIHRGISISGAVQPWRHMAPCKKSCGASQFLPWSLHNAQSSPSFFLPCGDGVDSHRPGQNLVWDTLSAKLRRSKHSARYPQLIHRFPGHGSINGLVFMGKLTGKLRRGRSRVLSRDFPRWKTPSGGTRLKIGTPKIGSAPMFSSASRRVKLIAFSRWWDLGSQSGELNMLLSTMKTSNFGW